MKKQTFQKSDEQILIESLELVNRAMLGCSFNETVMRAGVSQIKEGWSWVNCCQWLSGAKSLDALKKIQPEELINNLGFDQKHAIGIIYAVSAMCIELNLSQGGNYEKLTKLFNNKLMDSFDQTSKTVH